MTRFIDITDRETLNSLLSALKLDTVRSWGTMSPQDMIEHLVDVVAYSNGRKTTEMDFSEEESNMRKQMIVYGDAEMPRGIKGPDSEETKILIFPDLQTAINALNKELNDFEDYYEEKEKTAIHPAFGAMGRKEWLMWHGKHFTHHLKQFGLA